MIEDTEPTTVAGHYQQSSSGYSSFERKMKPEDRG
jgi:hypothetical protein